jgi:hypothetical protein
MKWRIYYADDSTYEGSTEKDAIKATAYGVEVIAIENSYRETGFGIVTGRDAYLYKDGRFWGCDEAGIWDHLYFYPGIKVILFGRTIDTDDYDKLVARALKEGLGV